MNRRTSELFDSEEKFSIGIAILGVVLLSVTYWGIPFLTFVSSAWQLFLQAIVLNLIPTLIVFLLAYLLLYRRIQKLRSEQEMENLSVSIAHEVNDGFRRTLTDFKELMPVAQFGWLFSGAQVVEIESNTRAKEIWIVSPHLLNDTDKEALPINQFPNSTKSTTQKNLKKKISYTFIVPKTARIKNLLPVVKQNYEGLGGQLRIIELSPQEFETLAFSEIAIYNPRMEGRYGSRLFIELPVSDGNAWWIEPNTEVTTQLLQRVRYFVDNHKE